MGDPLQNAPVVGMRKRFPRVFGRYILEKSLSRGGMGEVMLAVARHVHERCVIKTIRTDLTGDEEFVGRFADEAKIMVRIEHPNIIRVFDAGKVDNDYYIAMQYVHGRDLGDVLDRAYERGEPMPQGLGLYITDQLLRGLDYVHNLKDERGRHMGLVHRDISPQNVLIGFDGAVKLIDFGLARTDVLPARTQGALAVGKYGYMSPEQARHENIDGRADIYSAGVMLFEVFTGDRLVDEQDQATLWQRVLNPKHRSPKAVIPTLPDVIERLIMQAVEVNPSHRFESARQMREYAARLNSPDSSRDALIRYLRYLYPKVDFAAPPIPKFDDLMGGTEQSIIIATSDKGALSVFGRGDLPIEWTMQLDSRQIRQAVEESRRQARQRQEPVTDANMSTTELDAQLSSEPTLLRSARNPFDSSVSTASPEDDRTQVGRPPTSSISETTRYVRAPPDAQTPVEKIASLGAAPRERSPYRDDEMTVMMDAPPQARALFVGETPTKLSKLPEDIPSPTVQPLPGGGSSKGPSRRVRAIKEKNTTQDRIPRPERIERADRNDRGDHRADRGDHRADRGDHRADRADRADHGGRAAENRPFRKKAIEVHRRTVPVEPVAGPEIRPQPQHGYGPPHEAVVKPAPVPWMMWGIGLLGMAFLIVAVVVVVVAF